MCYLRGLAGNSTGQRETRFLPANKKATIDGKKAAFPLGVKAAQFNLKTAIL
jgi:hypothetical protein